MLQFKNSVSYCSPDLWVRSDNTTPPLALTLLIFPGMVIAMWVKLGAIWWVPSLPYMAVG